MKFETSVLQEGKDGVSIYIPSRLRENFNIEAGDSVEVTIAEEQEEGDPVDALLVILQD